MLFAKYFIIIFFIQLSFSQKPNVEIYNFLKENPHSLKDNDFALRLFYQDLSNLQISDYAKFIGEMYFEEKDYHDAFTYYFLHLSLKKNKVMNDTIFSKLYSIMTVLEESDFKNSKSKWEQFLTGTNQDKIDERYYEIIKVFYECGIEEHFNFIIQLAQAFIIQFPQSKFADLVCLVIAELYKKQSNEENALFYYRYVQKIYPKTKELPFALLREAELLKEEFKEYMKAKIIYDKFIEQFPKHKLHESALYEQAEMLYRKMDMQHLALETYQLYIKNYPKSQFSEKVYDRLITIYKSNKQFEEMAAIYREMVKQFGDSELSYKSQESLIELFNREFKRRDLAANEMIKFSELFPKHKYAADYLYDAALIFADELVNLKKSKEILESAIKQFPNADSGAKMHKLLNEVNMKLQQMQEILNKN